MSTVVSSSFSESVLPQFLANRVIVDLPEYIVLVCTFVYDMVCWISVQHVQDFI